MTLKNYFTGLLLTVFGITLAAQSTNRRPGELLIQLNADAGLNTVLTQLSRAAGAQVTLKDIPVPDWRIYLLAFDEENADADALLQAARRLPDVQLAQWNHRVDYRDNEPDDDDWSLQNDMTLIGMPKAWDVSTGGLTAARDSLGTGDTIVVAVLEKGSYLDHPDLAPNVWYNWSEIPNDGLDNDNNGYVDDYRGWNPRTKNDDPGEVGFHGTAVNGIIGARGNNNLGVAGLNWNVKLMNLSDVAIESEIIAGYGYAAKMRRLYNESNGQKGAFVVATNASFGYDTADADDYPLWCAAYDSLGHVGILSMGATTNKNYNVDEVGDMPTTCRSEYLIAVTEVTTADNRVPSAGYGKENIDLGSPGQGTYTTSFNAVNQTPIYNLFAGTSSATPHVTGAIAFLYSLNCKNLVADALTAPDLCARRIRDILLDNVQPNSDLDTITATGGRLDVANAVQAVQDQGTCDISLTGPLTVKWLPNHKVVHGVLQVQFQTPTYKTYQIRVFNMLGQLMYEESYDPDPFLPNVWERDFSYLASGAYVLSISRNDAIRSKIFLKI